MAKYQRVSSQNADDDSSVGDISMNDSSSSPRISTSLASVQSNGCLLSPSHSGMTSAAHNIAQNIAHNIGTSTINTNFCPSLDTQYKQSVFQFGNPINSSIGNSTNGNANNFNLFANAGYNNRHLNGFPPRYPSTTPFPSAALSGNFNPLSYNQYDLLNPNSAMIQQYLNTHRCAEPATNPVDDEAKTGKIKSEN